jgi:hypothetical protein
MHAWHVSTSTPVQAYRCPRQAVSKPEDFLGGVMPEEREGECAPCSFYWRPLMSMTDVDRQNGVGAGKSGHEINF